MILCMDKCMLKRDMKSNDLAKAQVPPPKELNSGF